MVITKNRSRELKSHGILQKGIIRTFLMLPLPAGEGWGDENHQKTGFKLIPFLLLVM